MTVTPDASFLVSLYGGDVNTPVARAWMVSHAEPVIVTLALRFETENALRLACFRSVISAAELQHALADIETDFALGILLARNLSSTSHWSEYSCLSAAHTLTLGVRAYDITHVASALLLRADTFLSFDQKQRMLAVAEGLTVAP